MSLSAADEKTSAGGGGPIGTRWLIPKFLTSALILALFLILLLDASLISLGATNPRPSAADLQSYHISTTLLPATTKNLSAAAAANFSTPSPQPPSAAESPTTTIPQSTTDSAASSSQEDVAAWISVALPANFTSTLLSWWLTPGGQPCRDSQTCAISVPGLDGIPHHHHSRLAAGEVHTFIISALDELGNKRCLGGDYFETDLSGESWKSRPPITDHGNGSYSFKLQVHPDFAGNYTLTIVLLFRSFHGLKFSPERFKFRRELRKIPISFYRTSSLSLPELNICRSSDFFSELWSGRWTRHARNDQCVIDDAGRFRCLEPDFLCQSPWCDGTLAALESNGWVYSAHCSFRIFSSDLAWKCLNNKWLFFWGDSNHVDTIRNLLNFVLGLTDIPSVPRRFDMKFTNRRAEAEAAAMRKKLDTRFPASRIKKIMQTDEDVGKIALAVPVLVSKALELFLQDLCDRTYDITLQRGVKTMSSLHLKQCVHSFNVFDFLKDIVSKVPDLGGSDAAGDDRSSKRRKAADDGNESDEDSKRCKTEVVAGQSSTSSSIRGRGRGRGRGRPRGSGRGGERDSARNDRFEDDPGTSPQHNDNKPHALQFSEAGLDAREQKETIVGNISNSGSVVHNFDLNLGLDENGDTSEAAPTATLSGPATDRHEMKHEEYAGWPLSDMDKMRIDPLELSLLNNRIDEEEEDYDNEDG